MISLPITVTTQSVPGSYIPPDDMQGLLEAVPNFTKYELNDNGETISINSSGGADFNGLWIWMIPNQAPRVMTGYRNSWWPLYTGLPGEIRMLVAPPAGHFDSSGRGLQYAGWDGWCLCNGQNGTVTLENLFIVPGYRFDGAGWVTNVDGADAYGNAKKPFIQLSLSNFPGASGNEPLGLTFYVKYNDFLKWNKYGSGELSTVTAPGSPQTKTANYYTWVYPIDQSAYMLRWPISTIPPYIALGYVQFMGYL